VICDSKEAKIVTLLVTHCLKFKGRMVPTQTLRKSFSISNHEICSSVSIMILTLKVKVYSCGSDNIKIIVIKNSSVFPFFFTALYKNTLKFHRKQQLFCDCSYSETKRVKKLVKLISFLVFILRALFPIYSFHHPSISLLFLLSFFFLYFNYFFHLKKRKEYFSTFSNITYFIFKNTNKLKVKE
jgi:hypothetical protein